MDDHSNFKANNPDTMNIKLDPENRIFHKATCLNDSCTSIEISYELRGLPETEIVTINGSGNDTIEHRLQMAKAKFKHHSK